MRMNLTHRDKVTIRKTITKLRQLHEAEIAGYDDPMTDAMGASEFVTQAFRDSLRRALSKACNNEKICKLLAYTCNDEALRKLEDFAVDRGLLKDHQRFNPYHMIQDGNDHSHYVVV